MSKWGQYQAMSTIAKKVGGPVNLGLIILGTGMVIGGATVLGVQKIRKMIKESKNNEVKKTAINEYNNADIIIKPGDIITVSEVDEDIALIKVNDVDEPFYISTTTLNSIFKKN